MASFSDITVGQQIEFQRVLAAAGFDKDTVRRIIKNPGLASKMLASLSSLPSWYISPERQLERVRQLNVEREWGFEEWDFPSLPTEFSQRTETEVLLLTVYLPAKGATLGLQRTFDELWDLIDAPDGFTKSRWNQLNSDLDHLTEDRCVSLSVRPGIRWVAFDPNAFHGLSPHAARRQAVTDNIDLAVTEVFMAALLFSTWSASWNGDSSPFPYLSGLHFGFRVPYLHHRDGDNRLNLGADYADVVDAYSASPSVREC